jgi:hypothetical protein
MKFPYATPTREVLDTSPMTLQKDFTYKAPTLIAHNSTYHDRNVYIGMKLAKVETCTLLMRETNTCQDVENMELSNNSLPLYIRDTRAWTLTFAH